MLLLSVRPRRHDFADAVMSVFSLHSDYTVIIHICQYILIYVFIFVFYLRCAILSDMDEGDFLTVQDVSNFLGIGMVAVRTSIRDGRLPSQRIFGRIVVKREDAQAYKDRTQPDGVKRVGRPKKVRDEGS